MSQYTDHPKYPKKIGESIVLKCNQIHPSICAGRNDSTTYGTKSLENFAIAFLLRCTDEELKKLWNLAENARGTFVELEFCLLHKKSHRENLLSEPEFKDITFFESHPMWSASIEYNSIDEILKTTKTSLKIVFTEDN